MTDSSDIMISKKIENVLIARKRNLPIIDKKIKEWKFLQENLAEFESAVRRLVEYAGSKDSYTEIVNAFSGYSIQNLHVAARENVTVLERMRERISRDTINIGVSGQARVGKSTLLQTIAGLSDNQVPSGSGVPVTAVRSQIFHSETREIAILKFHTFSSFRENTLVPFHMDLNLESPPLTMEGYESFDYRLSEDKIKNFSNTEQVLYSKLREMKESFSSYQHLLNGSIREISLDKLRPFVSYPTQKEEEELKQKCPRPYLAVKDAKIYTKFPRLQVKKIGLIDLPGLGELTSGAEEQHVQGLQNEVDFVVLVKRPVEGMAYWRKEDANALDVLDKAMGAAERKDFVFIFANGGDTNEELLTAMLKDILKQANEGINGKNYRTLSGNCKDPDSSYNDLLLPVMEHLAGRLPEMDRRIFNNAELNAGQTLKLISSEVSNSAQLIKNCVPNSDSTVELLEELVKKMKHKIARAMKELLESLFKKARDESEDDEYFQQVDAAKESVFRWASQGGLGIGKDQWMEYAEGEMAVAKGNAGIAENEFNRIRVHISDQFSSIDEYFQMKTDSLQKEIGKILYEEMGDLFKDIDAKKRVLQEFQQLIGAASEPCPGWEKAVKDLIDLEIKYRTHLHPRVRRCLDSLNYSIYSDNQRFSIDVDGARDLLKFLIDKTVQASNEVKKSLYEEYKFTAMVLHSACEQFDDSIIRSGSSQKEFLRFGRSYKTDIWPEQFNDLDIRNTHISRIIKAEAEILNSIQNLEEI